MGRTRKAHIQQRTATRALLAWAGTWRFWACLAVTGAVVTLVPQTYVKFPAALATFLVLYQWVLRDVRVIDQGQAEASDAFASGAEIHALLRQASHHGMASGDSGWRQVKLRRAGNGAAVEWTPFWGLRRQWQPILLAGCVPTRFEPVGPGYPASSKSFSGVSLHAEAAEWQFLISEPGATALYSTLSDRQ